MRKTLLILALGLTFGVSSSYACNGDKACAAKGKKAAVCMKKGKCTMSKDGKCDDMAMKNGKCDMKGAKSTAKHDCCAKAVKPAKS